MIAKSLFLGSGNLEREIFPSPSSVITLGKGGILGLFSPSSLLLLSDLSPSSASCKSASRSDFFFLVSLVTVIAEMMNTEEMSIRMDSLPTWLLLLLKCYAWIDIALELSPILIEGSTLNKDGTQFQCYVYLSVALQ